MKPEHFDRLIELFGHMLNSHRKTGHTRNYALQRHIDEVRDEVAPEPEEVPYYDHVEPEQMLHSWREVEALVGDWITTHKFALTPTERWSLEREIYRLLKERRHGKS